MERRTGDRTERETVWQVEILPPDPRRAHGAPPPGAAPSGGAMRTLLTIAVVAGALGLLAVMVAFAATIALVAVPVALGAGLVAWLGMKWRGLRGR